MKIGKLLPALAVAVVLLALSRSGYAQTSFRDRACLSMM